MPACLTSCAISPNVHGTFSEGLTMIVFPVAKAIGTVQNGTYISAITEPAYHNWKIEWDNRGNDTQWQPLVMAIDTP